MAYKIQYGTCKYDAKSASIWKLLVVFIVVIAMVGAVAQFSASDYLQNVRSRIFPFSDDHVQAAFREMVTQIGEGTSFSEAATVFCREILIDQTA